MYSLRRLMLMVLVALLAQAVPLAAQEAVPINIGETISGQLNEGGDFVVYSFSVPAGEDAVVALEADHVVMARQCVTVGEQTPECNQEGGGGGEGPISALLLVPAAQDATLEQQVLVTLSRPLDGPAQYTLAVYTMTVQSIAFGDIIAAQPAAEHPYRVYALTSDPGVAFSVEVEDSAASGAFLWAAYQPMIPGKVTEIAERTAIPQYMDGAWRGNNTAGVQSLGVYFLGQNSFRALVASTGRYSLHAVSLLAQPLNQGDVLPVTVSYREPLRLLRLNVDATTPVRVNANVTAGTGALVQVYSQDHPYGDGLALGASGRAGVPFPKQGAIDAGRAGVGTLVVVQIPFEFTRSQVTVEISWEPEA